MRVRELRVSYHAVPGTDGTRVQLHTPRTAAAFILPHLEQEACEVFMLILLDTKHRLIALHTVSRGTLDSTLIHPREVFKAALLANAATIITVHNHPSGDPTPSPDDLRLCTRLTHAGEIIGIPVSDHLIIGHYGRYWSRMEAGKDYGD